MPFPRRASRLASFPLHRPWPAHITAPHFFTMTSPTLLVLAAGMGSRFGGLKQIAPVGPQGETMLDYSVFDAIRAGFGKVVFVIREEFASQFRETVGARFADRIAIDYAFQRLDDLPPGFRVPDGRSKPWGTGHAVYAAREVVKEPCAVINADDFYGADAYRRAAAFLSRPDLAPDHYCLVGYHLHTTLSDHGSVNRGITRREDGILRELEEVVGIARGPDGVLHGTAGNGEARTLRDDDIVSLNCWGFPPQFFPALAARFHDFLAASGDDPTKEFFLPDAVHALIADGGARCTVLDTSATWFGVTYPDDLPAVASAIGELIARAEYPSPLA